MRGQTMYRSSDVRIGRCTDPSMYASADARIIRCPAQSMSLVFLRRFVSLLCLLPVSRRSFEAPVGLVGRRLRGRRLACSRSALSRARAALRFWAWVRCSRASMSSTPSVVMRLPASACSRCLTPSLSGAAATSSRSWTAVATLLTFCPPGPDARTKRSSIGRLERSTAQNNGFRCANQPMR